MVTMVTTKTKFGNDQKTTMAVCQIATTTIATTIAKKN